MGTGAGMTKQGIRRPGLETCYYEASHNGTTKGALTFEESSVNAVTLLASKAGAFGFYAGKEAKTFCRITQGPNILKTGLKLGKFDG